MLSIGYSRWVSIATSDSHRLGIAPVVSCRAFPVLVVLTHIASPGPEVLIMTLIITIALKDNRPTGGGPRT